MAPVAPILVRVTLPDVDGIAADEVVNSFAFATADVAAAVTAVAAFYNAANATHPLSAYLGTSRDRTANACLINTYELAGFLHGEPHGTPIDTETFTLGVAVGTDLPDQLSAVLAYHGDLSALPEHGPLAVRPTEEEAQDEGAPVTFMAKTRPRASIRGRLYLGPLTITAMASFGSLFTGFVVDAAQALNRLRTTGPAWGVWSRTYGTVTPILAGWIDSDFGVQRRRRDKSVPKIPWP